MKNFTETELADMRGQVEQGLKSDDAVAWRRANEIGDTKELKSIYFRVFDETSVLKGGEKRFVAAKLKKTKLWMTELNPVYFALSHKWLLADKSSARHETGRHMRALAVELDSRVVASALEWAMLSGDKKRYATMCASIDVGALPVNSHLYPDYADVEDQLRGWSFAYSITEAESKSYKPPRDEWAPGYAENFADFSSSLFTLAFLLGGSNTYPEYEALVNAKFAERKYIRVAKAALEDLSDAKLFAGMQNAWRAHGYPSKSRDEFLDFLRQRMTVIDKS